MSASTQPMSVDDASFDVAAKELDAHVQDDHKLMPVSAAEFSAYAQQQQQLDKECDHKHQYSFSSITRPLRQPKYESSESEDASSESSGSEGDRICALEDGGSEGDRICALVDALEMQHYLSEERAKLAKQTLRNYKEAAMERDMVVEQQREFIEQQQKAGEQKDAELSSLNQGVQQLKQQVQALMSRQQATQQDVTRTANAIVSTQPTAQLEDLMTQFGSMSFGQGSQVSANVVFSAKVELDRRSSRVPEASSSLKNKVEDFTRYYEAWYKDTLKVPKVEYQARTKQTARATTSQAAPRRAAAAPAGGAGSDDGDSSDDGTPTAQQVYGRAKLNELATESGFCIHQVAEVFFQMIHIACEMAERSRGHRFTHLEIDSLSQLIFDQAIEATKDVLCLYKMEHDRAAADSE